MNPSKTEDDLFHHLDPPIMDHGSESQPSILDPYSLPPISEIVLFRDDDDDDSLSHTSSDADDASANHHSLAVLGPPNAAVSSHNQNQNPNPRLPKPGHIDPDPHISTQFYTFNSKSHDLMIRCLLEGRLASPDEIRIATPSTVLVSWRSVWKDRNEDTAYLTAWKRIQDKLIVHVGPHGLKETIERIKQVWTVGAKFYGIPESFIRACVAECPVCSDSSGSMQRNKRRRFEYTESFDVPAKEVPRRLQQLAAKHKVVLCIRQKYIRYKPFMAEVKDYACHRAGEPASSKKSRILKREPYASKRCGCGFRIRAIVPIANYNEKDKTKWKMRVLGFMGKEDGDLQHSVLQQVQELRNVVGSLEGRIAKIPQENLGLVSQELFDVVNKLRAIGEYSSKPVGLFSDKSHSDDVLVGESDLADWGDHHHERIYGDTKDGDLIEEDEVSFGRTLGDVASWDHMRTDCRVERDLLGDTCKPEKWLKCSEFDEKSILDCEDSKLTKPMRHDENIVTDVGLVGIQVDSFYYPDNPKWYDSPCALDSATDCGDSGFRHGGIV
ncbi:hypothetical protein Acr_09g0006960 [Actinidia rufa]|uniref:Uncharacterized protein n=1 Tax=Actinidia rufa TaxID=165716 RepID=A0A7J0F6E7_9ERIC|nr:hypothetical protein Acr_09g0006960 [Actinidia rufa]